jgi:NADPH2:quinone reductase
MILWREPPIKPAPAPAEVEIPAPGPDEVVVRIGGAQINPSNLGLLVGPADMSTAKVSGPAERPVLTAGVPPQYLKAMTARLDDSLPVGNEGAGPNQAAS